MKNEPSELKWRLATPEETRVLAAGIRRYFRHRRIKNVLGCCVCIGSFIAILDLCIYM